MAIGMLSMISSTDEFLSANNNGNKYKKYSRNHNCSNISGKSGTREVIAAIFEGRGTEKGFIGFAWADEESVQWVLTDYRDSAGYMTTCALLLQCDPVEVIVADIVGESNANILLIEAIKSTIPNTTITSIQRRFFNAQRGFVAMASLTSHKEMLSDVKTKEHACSAMGALLRFVELKYEFTISAGTLPFKYLDVTRACLLDPDSWKNLEVVNENSPRQDKRTLLSIIDNTLTSVGHRMLRANLMQPLTDIPAIERRQNAVAELLDKPIILEQLIALLNRVFALEKVVNVCCRELPAEYTRAQTEKNVSQMLGLLQSLMIVPTLRGILYSCESELFSDCAIRMDDVRLKQMSEMLAQYLDPKVLECKRTSISVIQQKLFAFKSGLFPRIDASRECYMQRIAQVEECVDELEQHLPNENTRLSFSISRGFHYTWITNSARPNLPKVFIQVVRHRTCLTFSSQRLMSLNDRVKLAEDELFQLIGEHAQILIKDLRPLIGALYALIDDISLLDMLQSLAIYASQTSTCKPIFFSKIVIAQGRHPILDYHLKQQVVGNDLYLTPTMCFGMITGPNMAGKSTFLKQICHFSLLAQMGSFVPAIVCKLPVFHRIFSRLGHNDCISRKLSAFALEMKDTATILSLADAHTLIVIDELARSTSTEEGIAVSYAIFTELIKKRSFVLCATHFLDLAALDVNYSAVTNFHFKSTQEEDDNSAILHRLYKGPYKGPLYGFDIVQLSTFPPELVRKAEELALKLRADSEKQRVLSIQDQTRRLMLRCAHRLTSCMDELQGASHAAQIAWLNNLRENVREELLGIQNQKARLESSSGELDDSFDE